LRISILVPLSQRPRLKNTLDGNISGMTHIRLDDAGADPLSDAELNELDRLAAAASPAPWIAFTGPGIGGDDVISLGGTDDSQPDLYVRHDDRPAPAEDFEFIAAARNCVPRLIAEVRKQRKSL
jgi:hypothetical protein